MSYTGDIIVNSESDANTYYDQVAPVVTGGWGGVTAIPNPPVLSYHAAIHAVDNSGTKYYASANYSGGPGLRYSLNNSSVVNMIGLNSGNDHPARDPKKIKLFGRNASYQSYTLIGEYNVPAFTERQQWRYVQFDNEVAYNDYELRFTQTGGSEFQITEAWLYKRNDVDRISEHSTTMDLGQISIGDVNASTKQYIAATGAGRAGAGIAGFARDAENGLRTLHEWVGGMFYSNDASGGADGSLTTGPHAYTRFPGWKAHLASQNILTPNDDISLGDMRQHTPITIMARAQPTNKDSGGTDYYDGTDGAIVMRAYGVSGLSQVFSITIAGITKTFSSGSDIVQATQGGWWTGLGSGDGSAKWHAFRCRVGWTYDGVHGQEIANIGIGLGAQNQGATLHGRYGWGPVRRDPNADNWISRNYAIWTTRNNFTTNGTDSRFRTGGSQPPQDYATAGQEEFFYDWFYSPTKNIRLVCSGDDLINVWVHDCNSENVWQLGTDNEFSVSGRFATTPHAANITLPDPGWYQIIAGAKELPGGTPVHVGVAIWDRDEYGDGGPPNVQRAKDDEIDGYDIEHSDGFLWTTRLNSGYRGTGDGREDGQARYFSNAKTVGQYSDRLWWLPQQNKILSDGAA